MAGKAFRQLEVILSHPHDGPYSYFIWWTRKNESSSSPEHAEQKSMFDKLRSDLFQVFFRYLVGPGAPSNRGRAMIYSDVHEETEAVVCEEEKPHRLRRSLSDSDLSHHYYTRS